MLGKCPAAHILFCVFCFDTVNSTQASKGTLKFSRPNSQ